MLSVNGLAVSYGGVPVIEDIDLTVESGEFASLVGPSGSGKTSILRVVTGLVEPVTGTVELGIPVTDIGFLFQDDALLPWRTVRENVGLGLRIRGLPTTEADEKADHWLALLGLDDYGTRYPGQLSGGQRKRVAIAQILALEAEAAAHGRAVRVAGRDRTDPDHPGAPRLGGPRAPHRPAGHPRSRRGHQPRLTRCTCWVTGRTPPFMLATACRFPGPRHVLETRRDPSFGPLLERLWDDLSHRPTPESRPVRLADRRGGPRLPVGAWRSSPCWLDGKPSPAVGVLDPFYAPPPTAVGMVIVELVTEGELWPHLGAPRRWQHSSACWWGC